MKRYIVRNIGQNRGAPRIYLDIQVLADAGFVPGARYSRQQDEQGKRLVLSLSGAGGYKVSKKDRADKSIPVIDISGDSALSPFEGLEAVRIIIQEGRITILPIASDLARQKRLARLKSSLESGSISTASLSHGGGILDHAAHAGLCEAGLSSSLAFANEIDEALLDHSSEANSVWDAKTVGLGAPMQEVVQDEWLMSKLPSADVLCVGIPCSGASKAGAAKRGLEMMETHPEVGHLAASLLMVIQRIQPAAVVIECVKEYQNTASAQIIRQHLRDCGYETDEVILSAKDFGCLENRVRWFMVAATRGIDMDLSNIAPHLVAAPSVAQVLDEVPEDSPEWRTFDYLDTKRERDEAKGSGFRMQFVSPQDSSVPVLRKGYHKGGSTDPLLVHPSNPNLKRLFTVNEHARIKQIPTQLVSGLSSTKGHQLLGQSIAYVPVKKLFERIGKCLMQWLHKDAPLVSNKVSYSLQRATG